MAISLQLQVYTDNKSQCRNTLKHLQSGRPFQMQRLERNFRIFWLNLGEVSSVQSTLVKVMAWHRNRHKAIAWNNIDPVHWRIHTARDTRQFQMNFLQMKRTYLLIQS